MQSARVPTDPTPRRRAGAGLAARRLLAWLVDWLCILGWVALTAAIGVPLDLAGVLAPAGYATLNVIGGVVVVLPVVLAAGWAESRPSGATPGKRVLRLQVDAVGGPPSFRVALLRNIVKIGVPWLLGHAAVFAIVASSGTGGPVPVGVWLLTGAAYLMPIAWIVSLFVGGGRTPYDRICGTRVVAVGPEAG
ncbi:MULTISPECIES: RDD family protein [unclassified Agromyces]|uniref:RDD family protein n=1 Tax=unclassified Agromyces TaxID=2639701 RepID=UPI0030145DA1